VLFLALTLLGLIGAKHDTVLLSFVMLIIRIGYMRMQRT